jgi:hypothetical protein
MTEKNSNQSYGRRLIAIARPRNFGLILFTCLLVLTIYFIHSVVLQDPRDFINGLPSDDYPQYFAYLIGFLLIFLAISVIIPTIYWLFLIILNKAITEYKRVKDSNKDAGR